MSRTRLQDQTIRIAPPEGPRPRRSPGSSAQICRPVSPSGWLAPTAAAAPSIALSGMFCEVGSSLLLVLLLLWGEEVVILLVSCSEGLCLLKFNVAVKVDASSSAIGRLELVCCVDLESRLSLINLFAAAGFTISLQMKWSSLTAMIPTPALQHGRPQTAS